MTKRKAVRPARSRKLVLRALERQADQARLAPGTKAVAAGQAATQEEKPARPRPSAAPAQRAWEVRTEATALAVKAVETR
jgi:hypothetical protein